MCKHLLLLLQMKDCLAFVSTSFAHQETNISATYFKISQTQTFYIKSICGHSFQVFNRTRFRSRLWAILIHEHVLKFKVFCSPLTGTLENWTILLSSDFSIKWHLTVGFVCSEWGEVLLSSRFSYWPKFGTCLFYLVRVSCSMTTASPSCKQGFLSLSFSIQ